jgi:hypothetical protein
MMLHTERVSDVEMIDRKKVAGITGSTIACNGSNRKPLIRKLEKRSTLSN